MISIIIPTLNEEKEIEETLKNLEEPLRRGEIEVIISDGGSTDATLEIVKRYTKKIVVHSGAKRQTISHAKNIGAAKAVGEYLLFWMRMCLFLMPHNF